MELVGLSNIMIKMHELITLKKLLEYLIILHFFK